MVWKYTDMKKLEWEYNAFDSPKVCYSNESILGEAMEKFNSLIFLLLKYHVSVRCVNQDESQWILNLKNLQSVIESLNKIRSSRS